MYEEPIYYNQKNASFTNQECSSSVWQTVLALMFYLFRFCSLRRRMKPKPLLLTWSLQSAQPMYPISFSTSIPLAKPIPAELF